MADAPINSLSWYGLDKPTLPYKTNTSPIDETPHWVSGSSNTMATLKGQVEKRPGFATPVETAISAIPGTVVRLYTWRRFSGSFFIMASVTTTNPTSLSQVWKLEVGVDQSFSMIYADTVSTVAHPFDFVTSNNFCFFGNETTRNNMRKYNGTAISSAYQASLWGLDYPVSSPSQVLISPTLPPGLSFNGTSLVGTPITAGNYSVTFTATDVSGDTSSQSLSFSISTPVLDWQYPSTTLPFGENGSAYSTSGVEAWGGSTPYVYSIVSGNLPAGLTINSSTGVVSGTPTAVGNYAFAVKVTDAAGGMITREYSQFIGDPSISITPPSPNTGTVGTAYTGSTIVSGGVAPYSYALVAGSIPPGLSADSSGNLSGSPASSGKYTVTFQVTDSAGKSNQVSNTYTISSSALNIATEPEPPLGKVGFPYSFTPFASGGTGNQVSTSSTQVTNGSGNWSYVGTEWRSNFNPGTSALSNLVFQGFGFTVPTSATIIGIVASVGLVSQSSTTGTLSQIALYYTNALLGTIKTPGTLFNTTLTPQSYGGASDVWGATITPAIVNDPTFGFALAANADASRLFIAPAFQMTVYYSYPSTGITLTASPNAITAQTGYIYGQTFTSIYGHESSMSSLSSSTGIFTNEAVKVSVLSSADLQVNGINIYRTSDGGDADPAAMRLVASLPNVDASYVDSTLDIYLGLQTGPALYVNDPPQPLSGFVWSNGRIWGKNASYTWFTGNEEVTNGIPEECMSDALNGNFYAWPSQVGGMAVTAEGVDIGLSEQFWQISGDALATFRKSKLLSGGGTIYPINITQVGNSVMWIDTAKQAFSSSDGEFGESIRPDFSNLDLSQSFIGFHKSKLYNWMYILDALNYRLLIYDLDLNQWNPPWIFNEQVTAITSGEISVGNIQLIVAFNTGHVMYLTPGTFLDDGIEYGETLKSNLFEVVPGRGTTARNSAEVRRVTQFDMEFSMIPGTANNFIPRSPEYFGCLVDDDPAESVQSNYFDLSANRCDPQYQDQTVQKRYIAPKRWMVDQAVPAGRRIASYAQWNPSANGWIMFSYDLAWRS